MCFYRARNALQPTVSALSICKQNCVLQQLLNNCATPGNNYSFNRTSKYWLCFGRPVCGARKNLRAFAGPRFFRPLHQNRHRFICHWQRSAVLPKAGAIPNFAKSGCPCGQMIFYGIVSHKSSANPGESARYGQCAVLAAHPGQWEEKCTCSPKGFG